MPMPPGYGTYPYPGIPDYYANPGVMPSASPPYPGANPYAPQMTREQELDFLRNQAEAIKGQLEQIDVRIKELEEE